MKSAPLILLTAVAMAGCAGFSPDGGLGPVQQAARDHLGGKTVTRPASEQDHAALDARVAELLRAPLDADAAVQVALLNHRGLRASLHDIGLADALRVQATNLPNPGFSFGRFKAGDEREIERSLHFSLARVIALPWMRDAAQQQLRATQSAVAQRVVQHGMDTRRAWVRAVAARENLRYAQQVMRAAEAGAELARRMQQVGNFSPLQRAREQAFHADAALGVARAEQAERAARERLTQLMGLWGPAAEAYALPERLPDLPGQPRDWPNAERIAVSQRLDLQAARHQALQAGAVLGASKLSPWTDGLEIGLERNSEQGGPGSRGWEIGFELPLFDGGAARRSLTTHAAQQAALRAEQVAIDARSEAREAWHGYRHAWDTARHHREEIVPLRQRILDENVLRYNGMLIGVFELLADARVQIASVQASIDALRDFWLAETDLEAALIGRPLLDAGTRSTATPSAPAGGDAH